MANEFSMIVSLTAASGGASIASGSLSKTSSAAALPVYMQSVTQSIGFAAVERLSYNTDDIVTVAPVYIAIKNLDATNYVTIYKEIGGTNVLSILKAGQSCLLVGVPANALYAQANTAAVAIQFWMTMA